MAQSPSILTPLQQDFLREFFACSAAEFFFLTGGTALAEYYLQHRYSEDIDLFTLDSDALDAIERELPALAKRMGCDWTIKVKAPDFRMGLLTRPSEPTLKIDLVRDVGTQFGEHRRFDTVIVDSLLNIAVNKVTAIFGRTAAKDYVDLYFLLHQGFQIDELAQMAKQKDLGFTEFYFAGSLRQIRQIQTLPRMLKPLSLEELGIFYEQLAKQTMLKLKPPA